MADPTAKAASSTEVIPAGHAAPSTDEEREGPAPPSRARRALARGARHCVRRYRDEPCLYFPRVLQP
jgi:hypothetical protein